MTEPTNELFEKHEKLLWSIVNKVRIYAPFMDADDMFAQASLKWVEAVRAFNNDGVARETYSSGHLTRYLYIAIRRSLIDYCRKQDKHRTNCVTTDDDRPGHRAVLQIPDLSGTPEEERIRMADVQALPAPARARVEQALDLAPKPTGGERLRPRQLAEVREQVATLL